MSASSPLATRRGALKMHVASDGVQPGHTAKHSVERARPEGLEPPASWSVARRSIHLSYGRSCVANTKRSAEEAGFEPARELSPPTRLAGGRTRPDYATPPYCRF